LFLLHTQAVIHHASALSSSGAEFEHVAELLEGESRAASSVVGVKEGAGFLSHFGDSGSE
jgi:hypothetical protein